MRIIFTVMLLVWACKSHAGCHDLLIGQRSFHFDKTYREDGKEYNYNNANYMLGCITDDEHVVTIFRNSYKDTSVLLAHKWSYTDFSENITPYLVIGVATGYGDRMAHIGAFSPYGFVGVDIHPASSEWGIMLSTVGEVTSIGFRFALK